MSSAYELQFVTTCYYFCNVWIYKLHSVFSQSASAKTVSISVQFDCVLDDIGLTVVHHCGFFTYQKM